MSEENNTPIDKKIEKYDPDEFTTVSHVQRYINILSEAIVEKLANLDDQVEEVADQLEKQIDSKIEEKLKKHNNVK